MLWPFSKITGRSPTRGTIETIYGMIVAQARMPLFYQAYGVPDTVNGRVDMVLLHLWLVLRRMRSVPDSQPLAQDLIDHFCSDMDDNLRELGVGDLKVPKRILQFGEAFYGRARAYDEALIANGDALVRALERNVYAGQTAGGDMRLARYVRRAIQTLDGMTAETLLGGRWRFPTPEDGEPS